MPFEIKLAEQVTVIGLLALFLWTGHRGYWYWSPGRAGARRRARPGAGRLAGAGGHPMRKQGIELPEGDESPSAITLPGTEDARKR